MERLLDQINSPADLKKIPLHLLPHVAEEIRALIIKTISNTGGHLASSLGVVELTIALHYIYNTPQDKIIWDVGHQSYAHKILTGRREKFHLVRQEDGISGFPNIRESEYDSFGTGHASTSISAALGMAEARDQLKQDFNVLAVIGDGALSGGMAFEALNHAGDFEKKNLTVILNDNKMSISPNVGALSSYLGRIITGARYNRFKGEVEALLKSIPSYGDQMYRHAKKLQERIKGFLVPEVIFQELGFKYVGPIDGHNFKHLLETLNNVRNLRGPILIHVVTRKGKGYNPSEKDASAFHGVSPFYISNGKLKKCASQLSYTDVFATSLIKMATHDARIVAITAAMPQGTGLDKFAAVFPDRTYDVGIAEQHAVTFAAGMAIQGLKPVVAIYSTFLQRSYDQIVHDVCLQNLPVVFALDRAGIVGEDGPTHHGNFDISYLRHIPNMVLMAPKDENELQNMLATALSLDCPVSIRYPRGCGYGLKLSDQPVKIPLGRAELLAEGHDILLIGIGSMVHHLVEAARLLQKKGIRAAVINARFVKPLDRALISKWAQKTGLVLTAEENVLAGGFGSAVMEMFEEENLENISLRRIGIPDAYVQKGSQDALRQQCGLTAENIATTAEKMVLIKSRTHKMLQSRSASGFNL